MSTFAFDFLMSTYPPPPLEVKHYEYNLQIGENNLLTIITTSISNTLAYKIK
jgi:hypothetical protein